MRLETILNAYDKAGFHCDRLSGKTTHKEGDKLTILYYRRVRQSYAFRARIPRMDDYKNEQEAMLRLEIDELYIEIEKKDEEIHWLNQRVHELKGEIECIRSKQ